MFGEIIDPVAREQRAHVNSVNWNNRYDFEFNRLANARQSEIEDARKSLKNKVIGALSIVGIVSLVALGLALLIFTWPISLCIVALAACVSLIVSLSILSCTIKDYDEEAMQDKFDKQARDYASSFEYYD